MDSGGFHYEHQTINRYVSCLLLRKMGRIYIGTSGYSYKHWKEVFYPKGLAQAKWLPFYAEHFNTVEINATFYRHFGKHVFENWNSLTPDGFNFTIKGPKTITRDKRLENVEEELTRFMESAQGLGEKLGVMLWQLPPSFKQDEENLKRLKAFLELLSTTIRQVIEFRHPTWVNDEIFALLNSHHVGWVAAESKRYLSVEKVTGGTAYFRYHGPRELYASSYSNDELNQLAQKMRDYAKTNDVYCYFNNDFHGYAIENGRYLCSLLS